VKKFEKKNLNSNILYINLLSQLKLRMLADFERLPIMKLNEYWCNSDLFCNVKDNIFGEKLPSSFCLCHPYSSTFSSLNPHSRDRPLLRGPDAHRVL
jgi:hypothetical protein